MMRRMRTSKAGIELIKSFEGFRARAVQLPDGTWTIGHAHTKSARKNLRITRADAEAVLREYDLPPIEQAICDEVLAPLNQNEFDALVSFAFNIGKAAFAGSNVLAHLNSGERLAAAEAFLAWRKAYLNGRLIVVDALVRRRVAEQALFLRDPAGTPIAPSGFVRPVEDTGSNRLRDKERASQPLDEPTLVGVCPMPQPSSPPEPEHNQPDIVVDDLFDPVPQPLRAGNEPRLLRVLGDGELEAVGTNSTSNEEADRSAGPTPDEITQAISALANPDGFSELELGDPTISESEDTTFELGGNAAPDAVEPPSQTPPPFDSFEDDLPPLPIEVDPDTLDTELAPLNKVAIDDLEAVEIDPETVQQAIADAENDVTNETEKPPVRILHWVMGITGLLLGLFGILMLTGDYVVIGQDEPGLNQYLMISALVFGLVLIVLAFGLAMRGRNRSLA